MEHSILLYIVLSQQMSDAIKHITDEIFLSWRQRIGAYALCVQHNPTTAALSTSFLLNHAPSNSTEMNALITRFRDRVIQQREYESWVKKAEEIKDGLVEFWQCTDTDTAFERLSCFPVLPDSAEAQVILGGTVKRLLIAYFIGNISAKKISKCIYVCQSYSKSKVGRFFNTHCI